MTSREPMMAGPYPADEVLSALRKTIKLNDVEAAIYWANVTITRLDHGPVIVAKQLWIMAAEDIDDPQIVLRAFAVYQMAGRVPETDHLFFLVAAMCKARKWWEHEEGREVDRLWAKAEGDLKDPARRRQIPEFALDRHTKRGWDLKAQAGWFRDEFSGTDLGRMKTSYLYQRDGFIDAESRIEADRDGVPDHGFWAVWRERKRLQGDDLPDHDPEPVSLFDEGELVEGEDQ